MSTPQAGHPTAPPDIDGISSASEIRFGSDPDLDAWILHFMTENNLDYLLNPYLNASPEQMRFMVHLEDNQLFAPCSDEVFKALLSASPPPMLSKAYETVWRVVQRLVRQNITSEQAVKRILGFCEHRYRQVLASHALIPSRLMKRLAGIVLTQSGLQDPYMERKKLHNERVDRFINSQLFEKLVHVCPDSSRCGRIEDLRWELDLMELQRLFTLSSWGAIWHGGHNAPSVAALEKEISKGCVGTEHLTHMLGPQSGGSKKILYLPRCSGAIIFDIMIIRCLLRQGHQVMLALKEGFYFQAPTIWDLEHDPVLSRCLADAHLLQNERATKNELLRLLREHQFVVLSDGTMERLNLYRASVTFARAWKEADLIITKGHAHVRRLINTGHEFTRDILCFQRDALGTQQILFKPRAKGVRKISEGDLRNMADSIIEEMRKAKHSGRSVIFYSAIVGSIPGQTQVAIQVLTTFVDHLRERMEGVFIINPAEHFEAGMDGDDLMYMWERVQRSGFINIWRFQTVNDIEKSFDLMGRKVPPIWAGKDSTFSTGCTKEMHIALDVQRQHPELQIIGPSSEKFFRRREYGVGKFFDAGIEYM